MRQLSLIIFQCIIFGQELGVLNVRALVGVNILPASHNEFPSVACILRYNPDIPYEEKLVCTGTFISQTHLLTAEHCLLILSLGQVEIVIGAHNVDDGVRLYPIWWLSYDAWMKSQNRMITSIENDLSIIKVIGMTDNIVPANLLFVHPADSWRRSDVQIAGCGLVNNRRVPSVLHKANLRILDFQSCLELVAYIRGYVLALSREMLCSIAKPFLFIESGDSGGPLFYQNSLIAVNVAVCPKLNGTFNANKVNIHINLGFYQDYVNSVMLV